MHYEWQEPPLIINANSTPAACAGVEMMRSLIPVLPRFLASLGPYISEQVTARLLKVGHGPVSALVSASGTFLPLQNIPLRIIQESCLSDYERILGPDCFATDPFAHLLVKLTDGLIVLPGNAVAIMRIDSGDRRLGLQYELDYCLGDEALTTLAGCLKREP